MIKKILFVAAAVLISTSSLFAYSQGAVVLYPEVGIGVAGGQVTAWKGSVLTADINDYVGGSYCSFKDAELKTALYWSVGFNGSYFFNDYLSLTGGLFIDKNSFEVVYKTNPGFVASALGDLKYKIDLYRLTIPVGIRFHYSLLMAGGGLYLGAPMSYKATSEYDGEKEKDNISGKASLGLFIDAGVNIKTTDTNNLLLFLRFKSDLTPSYEEKDEIISKIQNRSISINVAYGFQTN
ncbi:MAG: hypothetical protein FWG13_01845 [Leptospirales bacterium]|nr:hypothetical protein [Leptospirales bacterium]